MKEICKLAEEKGFKRWFSDYSEKHHFLKGWLEYDNYLDEVELPNDIMFCLIQKWIREAFGADIQVLRNKPGYNEYKAEVYIVNNSDHYKYFHVQTDDGYIIWFPSYEEALKAGIKETLKTI